MKCKITDFIGVFSDVYPEGFCEHFIKEFERVVKHGAGTNRQQIEGVSKHQKEDLHISLNTMDYGFERFQHKAEPLEPKAAFFKGLQSCFDVYAEEYSVLNDVDIKCNNMKIQKTSSGGGYHLWHYEHGNGPMNHRSVVYTLYLNTIPSEANGETEFLYQQRRISPVANTLVLWPAGFTHPHRGNPVYGDHTKYIVTGWFYNE